MKYFISLFIILLALGIPSAARADEVSSDDWAFLYEFPLAWNGSQVTQAEPYRMTTGDAPAMPIGAWSFEMLSESGQRLQRYTFDPESMASQGKLSLVVPLEYRGARAQVFDPSGKVALTIDIRESRICDDDAVCDADAGERSENCPTDCGGVSLQESGASVQTAALLQQATFGERVGSVILRIASGMAGVLLLVGVVRMLDSRRRA